MFGGAKLVGDIASMNQALVSGEIDFHLTGGTYSVSPARADGHPELRGITPNRGPMGGKGGIAWIEITSTVANPELSPLAVRVPRIRAATPRRRISSPSPRAPSIRWPRWAIPKCFERFSREELDAIQWDSLEEEMAGRSSTISCPITTRLLDLMTAAKRARG